MDSIQAVPTLKPALRPVRGVSEREIALALVLELAHTQGETFSLLGFYDHDVEFVEALAERLQVACDLPFRSKLKRVVRVLVSHGVLSAEMRGTRKEYLCEPAKQMNYSLRPGKGALMRRGETEYTWQPEEEAAWLLRRAYPAPEKRV